MRAESEGAVARIGVLGGSFDPVHFGHLVLAEGVREALGMEKVLFVPAGTPPHKLNHPLATAEHRMEMTRLAVEGNRLFGVSDVEVRREGASYTIDTVRELTRIHDGEIFLIVGGDTVGELGTWKDVGELLRICKLAVGIRPGFALPRREELERETGVAADELLAHVVGIPQVDISSTDIRRRASEGKTLRYLVPERVREYIEKEGLYEGGRRETQPS